MIATLKSDKITVFKSVPILSMDNEFAIGTSINIAPTDGWTSERPEIGVNEILWQRVKVTYNDGTVEYLSPTPASGENGKAYALYISSSNGTSLKNGKLSTILNCFVLLNGKNITKEMDSSLFSWNRESEDSMSDSVWNSQEKLKGTKNIPITEKDCIGNTIFMCKVKVESDSYLTAIIAININLNPILIEYQYSDSDRTPPNKFIPFIFGNSLVYFRGSIVGDNNDNDWVDDSQKLEKNPAFPHLWMRVSNDDGQTWKYSLISGPPLSVYSIESSKDSYRLNSRGAVDEEDTVNFWATTENIANYEPYYWAISPQSLANYNNSLDLRGKNLNIKIPVGYSEGYIKVYLRIGNTGESKTKEIFGSKHGEKIPQKQPIVYTEENLPDKSLDGISPLIEGDYCLVEYPTGERIPYRYGSTVNPSTGNRWWKVEGGETNYSEIMGNLIGDVINGDNTVTELSAFYGFFKNLVSNNAFIEFLESRHINVKGSIYGGNYNKDGEWVDDNVDKIGFYIDKNGVIKSNRGIFNDATIDGSFYCYDNSGNIFHTTKEVLGESFTISSPERWGFWEFKDKAYRNGLPIIYNGISYVADVFEKKVETHDDEEKSETFTIPADGLYEIEYDIAGRYLTLVIEINDERIVYIDNKTTEESKSIERSLHTGDKVHIVCKTRSTSPLDPPNVVQARIHTSEYAIFFLDEKGISHAKFDDFEVYMKYRLTCDGFDSNDHIRFSSINALFGLKETEYLYMVKPNNIINIENKEEIISLISNNRTYIKMVLGDGRIFIFEKSYSEEFEKKGWYIISGTVNLLESKRGITVNSIFPNKVNGTTDGTLIGNSDNRFGSIHSKYINSNSIDSQNITGNVNDEENRNSYRVWGAVAN